MKLKNKKAIGLFLSFAVALGVVVPGTLAAEEDTDTTTDSFLIDGEVTQDTDIPDVDISSDDEPETPAHIDGCSDECTDEGCACSCHAEEPQKPADPETPAFTHKEGCPLYAAPELDIAKLYSRLMAMQTQEEIILVLMELSPETIAEFTDEQAAAIEAHYDSLSTTAAVSGDTMTPGDETVVGSSEVRYLTYDFTDAAPFMDPVEGGN